MVTSAQGKKENVLLGTLGALIGCVLGGILWMVVGYFGYFVFWAGLLIVFLGIKGYEKGAGRLSNRGLLIVGFMSILTALSATYITWSIILTQDYNQFFGLSGNASITVFEMLPVTHEIIFTDPELRSALTFEVFLSLLFIIAPTLILTFQYNRELKDIEITKNESNEMNP